MKASIGYPAALFFCMALTGFNLTSFAQDAPKSKTLIITRGDTVINGKHFNTLSKAEKDELMKDFPSLKADLLTIDGTGIRVERELQNGRPRIKVYGRSSGMGADSLSAFRMDFDTDSLRSQFRVLLDSAGRRFPRLFDSVDRRMMAIRPGERLIEVPGNTRRSAPQGNGVNEERQLFERPIAGSMTRRNNTQSFSYNSVDKNGIETRVSFRVSDADKSEISEISGTDVTNTVVVNDLTISPAFSTGKTTLTFTLSSTTTASIRLLDEDFKTIYSEKIANTSSPYSVQVLLPRNGVYYLAVNQGSAWTVKRIVKQN